MTTQIHIRDARGAPAIGETYLVNAIRMQGAWWPILGHPHADRWMPDFHHAHFDSRFLAPWQLTIIKRILLSDMMKGLGSYSGPLTWQEYIRVTGIDATGKETSTQPFKCEREIIPWEGPANTGLRYLLKGRSKCPVAIVDGAPHCPHQKLPLASVWDGKSKTVRCPLHGLEVDMTACLVPHG